jgi:hypothetical protein
MHLQLTLNSSQSFLAQREKDQLFINLDQQNARQVSGNKDFAAKSFRNNILAGFNGYPRR